MNVNTQQKIKKIIIRLSEEFAQRYNVVLNEQKVDTVFETYKNLREKMRQKMESEKKLDKHKIAALFVFAIVANEPIQVIGENLPYAARVANYHIAFKTGLAILASFKHKSNFTVLPKYTQEFFRLLHINKETIKQICAQEENRQIGILFFVSHIFYFLDECDTLGW